MDFSNFASKLLRVLSDVGGLIAIPGALYLYFEKRRFERWDAERNHTIHKDERQRLEQESEESRLKNIDTLDVMEFSLGRLYGVSSREKREAYSKLERDLDEYSDKISKEKAHEEYFKKMKNHKFLWFLPRSAENEEDEILEQIFFVKPDKTKWFKNWVLYILITYLILGGVWFGVSLKKEAGVMATEDDSTEHMFPSLKEEIAGTNFYGNLTTSGTQPRYANDLLGFSLELPAGMNISLQVGEVWKREDGQEYNRYYFHFAGENEKTVAVNVEETQLVSIDDWYAQNSRNGLYFQDAMKFKEEITVSGTPAVVLSPDFESPVFAPRVFFIHSGLLYDVSMYGVSSEEGEQVLSSFQFEK